MRPLLVLLLLLPLSASGEFSGDLSLGAFTDYLYRGRLLYDGPSIQPAASGSYLLDDGSSLNGRIWMHLPGAGEEKGREFSELDSTISYDTRLGPTHVSVGHEFYTFIDRSAPLENTAELFGSIAFDTFLQPKTTLYWDYQSFDYNYIELSLSQRLEFDLLRCDWNITPYAIFGWAISPDSRLYSRSGLEQITFGVLTEFEGFGSSILPTLAYTSGIDELTESTFWGGITVSFGD